MSGIILTAAKKKSNIVRAMILPITGNLITTNNKDLNKFFIGDGRVGEARRIINQIKSNTMYVNEKTSEILNDLISINNDRIEGYNRAENETSDEDADLKTLFRQMASESRSYNNDLSKYVASAGEQPTDKTSFSGKIYRTWMDVKATFTGKDRKAILASCEFGEDAAQKAYDEALSSDAELPAEVRQLIMDQKLSLKKSHDHIKALRDRQTA